MIEYDWIRPYLASDEYVLWQGKPEKGSVFTKQDIFVIPFSIVWCGFSLFWEYTALKSNTGFMALFGLPFVLFGLYFVFGRFIFAKKALKKTAYAVTNKRIFIYENSNIKIIDRNQLPPANIETKKDGSGTITFGDINSYDNRQMNKSNGLYMFKNIPDVNRVWNIIINP